MDCCFCHKEIYGGMESLGAGAFAHSPPCNERLDWEHEVDDS